MAPDVAFSLDGQWIASASRDGTVKLWPVPLLETRIPAADAPGLAAMIARRCVP